MGIGMVRESIQAWFPFLCLDIFCEFTGRVGGKRGAWWGVGHGDNWSETDTVVNGKVSTEYSYE